MDQNRGRASRAAMAMAASVLAALMLYGGLAAAQMPKLKIGTLGAPSTSVWMVAVLQAKRFDLKNGIDIEWVEQPSTAAVYNDFAAGSYPVATGGVISYANQYARGVKSKLFATYQIFGTSIIVNTERAPNIHSLKDLSGKEIAAPLASENTKAMEIYLKWAGVDVKSLKIKNFEQPGVVAELKSPTGSALAGIVFSQVPTRLVMDDPKKFKDLVSADELDALWRQKTGTDYHWLLGWVAHDDFAKENRELLQKTHNAMKETIEWFYKNSDEALEIVAKKSKESVPVLRETIKAKRVRFMQLTAESQEKALIELFKQGADIGMIAKLPDATFFYRGLK
jgi:ABC-type nitrate/sulfonate/bicarbonate transport system substrate-binding protein